MSEKQGRHSSSPLVRNALALMVSSMGSSGVGVIFWGVAAHLASVESIGRAAAELSAMSLLACLASLSLGSTFIRFLPVSGDQTRRLVARSYGACTFLALILALSFFHHSPPARWSGRRKERSFILITLGLSPMARETIPSLIISR